LSSIPKNLRWSNGLESRVQSREPDKEKKIRCTDVTASDSSTAPARDAMLGLTIQEADARPILESALGLPALLRRRF
jgi:hypothetical protein